VFIFNDYSKLGGGRGGERKDIVLCYTCVPLYKQMTSDLQRKNVLPAWPLCVISS
jgi:hypothetical protein